MFIKPILAAVLAALPFIAIDTSCSAGDPCPRGNVDCMCVFTDCPCITNGDAGVCTSMDDPQDEDDD